MLKWILFFLLSLNFSAVCEAYDSEYGDEVTRLPAITILNPLDGNLEISSDFSLVGRVHPVFGSVRPHKGTDIAAAEGANIYATHEGVVSYAGWAEGYGNVVYLNTMINGTNFETRYAHCSALLVSEGQKITAGTIIARVGSTGWSTGPHLHFEIRINGEPINPRRYLKDLPPSSGTGYGTLPESLQSSFDAMYDFGKPLREVIENFGSVCQEAIAKILEIIRWLLMVLITIDLAIGASLFAVNPKNDSKNVFKYITLKLLLYVFLIYFLVNWSTVVANFAKELFTGFGGMMMGASAEEAMKAISNPMDIVSKGANIVAPIFNELFKIHGVMDMVTKIALWLPSLFFAVILTICFFIISAEITLANVEFYIMMITGFTTFFFAGLKQTRHIAAKGLNGIFTMSIKLMFICVYSLMLQFVLYNIEVDNFYSVAKTEVGSGEISSIEQLMAHIREVESSNRYYVDNGLGYFGAYQIDYANYDNWTNWTADYVANGGVLESAPVTAEEPHGPAWTPTNQDNIARYILTGYYKKYGSYEMAARCWNQGEGGRLNSDADIYWAKVSGTEPTTGNFREPTATINMMLLFKVTFVTMMFYLIGSRISKDILGIFGSTGGFKFLGGGKESE